MSEEAVELDEVAAEGEGLNLAELLERSLEVSDKRTCIRRSSARVIEDLQLDKRVDDILERSRHAREIISGDASKTEDLHSRLGRLQDLHNKCVRAVLADRELAEGRKILKSGEGCSTAVVGPGLGVEGVGCAKDFKTMPSPQPASKTELVEYVTSAAK